MYTSFKQKVIVLKQQEKFRAVSSKKKIHSHNIYKNCQQLIWLHIWSLSDRDSEKHPIGIRVSTSPEIAISASNHTRYVIVAI